MTRTQTVLRSSTGQSLIATARALREEHIHAVTLTRTLMREITALDPELNGFITPAFEQALLQAEESDRRLRSREPRSQLEGVPIAFKDNIDVAGLRTSNGARLARIADVDAGVVAALRNAGAVFLGKLNMHEGALGATSDNPHFGPVHNPLRAGYTPGGSSGGSAAVVAANLCLATLGTDTMGSVRLPAAYCGVVGFKPSHGRVSTTGVMPLCTRLDCVGPIARSVDDVRAMFSVLETTGDKDARSHSDEPRVAKLSNFDTVPLDAAVETAFAWALGALFGPKILIESVTLSSYEPSRARRAGLLLSERHAAGALARGQLGERGAYSDAFLSLLDYGRNAAQDKVQAAALYLDAVRDECRQLFTSVDVIVSPTTPQTAFPFLSAAPSNQADFTALANIAGCPAISLPAPVAPGALPVGIQLIAAPGRDHALLDYAYELQQRLDVARDDTCA